jgi:predicted Zn finger-like uncharacterized protein
LTNYKPGSMYTQCPDCQTRFRVTADALRAARGTVRCGRCGSAFDALAQLSDTIPLAVPELTPVSLVLESEAVRADELATETPVVVVDESSATEAITLEGERVRVEETQREGVAAVSLDATDEVEALRGIPESVLVDEFDSDTEIEALVQQLQRELEPDDLLSPERLQVEGPSAEPAEALDEATWPVVPEPAPQLATPPPVTEQPAAAEAARAPAAAAPEDVPLAARRWRPPPVELEPEPPVAHSPWRTAAWAAGSLGLAIVLAAQVVHHFRLDLLRDARLGPPLRAAYARAGIDLPPAWDLAAFELNQWSAEAARPGSTVVRASLRNRASFAQPLPILRLEFEDRYGVTVASRDFEPGEYLKDPSQASRLLAAGASSEAELELADPGGEAVGYRLDVCLRESDALLRCARGPG